MRTQGTFDDVFKAVKEHMSDSSDTPMSPVIRRVGEQWMLESGVYPNPDADLEVVLLDFVDWWHEGLTDNEYQPDESAVAEYVDAVEQSQGSGGWE